MTEQTTTPTVTPGAPSDYWRPVVREPGRDGLVKTATRGHEAVSQAAAAWRDMLPWKAGTMSGHPGPFAGAASLGQLPAEHHDAYRRAMSSAFAYEVRSYGTPIAWTTGPAETWQMPDQRYSLTTSRHQSFVSLALGVSLGVDVETLPSVDPRTLLRGSWQGGPVWQ